MIIVYYSSIDGCRETRKYKTLEGARRFAQEMIGRTPEMGSYYAVSGDGVGKIEVKGVLLRELFPMLQVNPDDCFDPESCGVCHECQKPYPCSAHPR